MASLLTPIALADRLQVSLRTVRRITARRQIEGHRVGGQWRYTELAVERYLERTRIPAVKPWKGNGR